MKLRINFRTMLLISVLFFVLPATADQNLACSTGEHTCSLHNQHDQHVGDHCQCDGQGGHHSAQGTVVNLVCSTHSGHTCSTSSHHVGGQCGCHENGHEVAGTVVVDHHSNQNNNQNGHNQNNRNQQH